MNAPTRSIARQQSQSLSYPKSPYAPNDDPEEDAAAERPRFRRRASMRQGEVFNSFSTSRHSSADNRNTDGALLAHTQGKKGGLFQFRRRSVITADEYLEENMPYTLSSFQQVFHEMKAENPTASIGAVQQMTMRRLSEIQQIEKEEQDRLRSLADRDNEEKMGVAARALHKFVDVIRVTAPDEVEGQRNTATSLNTSDPRQSFDSFVKKVSAQRRGSHNSIFSDFNASNDSLFGGCTPARTANEMYAIAAEEQGDNMALRKSIGDFTAMLSVGDMSNRSNGSLRSELSGLLLEELAQTAQDEPSPGHTESMNVGSSQDDNFDTGLFAAYTLQIGESTNCSVSADAEGLYAEMDDYRFTTTAQSEKEATRIDSSDDPSKNDNFYLNDSRHSIAKSVLSALSSCPSVCSDGLIVGFRPRPLDTELEVNQDEDHLNSGNFASDFSAWEN